MIRGTEQSFAQHNGSRNINKTTHGGMTLLRDVHFYVAVVRYNSRYYDNGSVGVVGAQNVRLIPWQNAITCLISLTYPIVYHEAGSWPVAVTTLYKISMATVLAALRMYTAFYCLRSVGRWYETTHEHVRQHRSMSPIMIRKWHRAWYLQGTTAFIP